MQREGPPSLRILLVEDEESLREAFAAVLREDGHDLVEAATVERAREALAAHPVDVVILDLHVSSGTTEALLADVSRATATVLTSADVSPFSTSLAARYGVALLRKPFDLDELVPAVLRAHHERSSRAE